VGERQGALEGLGLKSRVLPAMARLADRTLLVTGDTGFKGAWLVTLLERLGAHCHGFALAPATSPSLHALLGRGAPEWGYGDLRDDGRIARVMAAVEPEVVLHLAAQPLVRRSHADPAGTFATNTGGTVAVLEAARHCRSVRAIVVVTTDKCYRHDRLDRPFREEDALGGPDPYSASKAAAELVAASYRESFFARAEPAVGLATARAGNVLGGGDWSEDRLLPDVLRAIESGRPVRLRYPHAVRPWQHVLDVAAGYAALAGELLADPARAARGWNFAPADASPIKVHEVVELAMRAAGSDLGWQRDAGEHVPEALELRLDASRAREELGWQAALSPREAVQWTVDWHAGLRDGRSAADLCAGQIDAHLGRLGAGS
jgi:CDP-glucose 4,6-dehydratase